jgi:Methylamine utilisation protein MauE
MGAMDEIAASGRAPASVAGVPRAGSSPAVPAAARAAAWLAQVPRWFVGLVLIATGVGKLLDVPGFVGVLAAYDLLPTWANVALAHTLPFVELATGIALVTGRLVELAGWAAVGLHVMLLSAVFITLARGLEVANCGCFGVFLARPLTLGTAVEDGVMLALSAAVVAIARRGGAAGR